MANKPLRKENLRQFPRNDVASRRSSDDLEKEAADMRLHARGL